MRRLDIGHGEADLEVYFDGVALAARRGETLASTLLAAGIDEVSRSIYRKRPRGVFSCGPEEPNAIVSVARPDGGAITAPATTLEVWDGLRATSLGGPAPISHPGDGRRDHAYRHRDVVVVGAGPAGLSAAHAAASAGASVTLVDDRPVLGGRLRAEGAQADGRHGGEVASDLVETLDGLERLEILTHTTAVGINGAAEVLAVERRDRGGWREPSRLWHLRARHIILATGAYERPIVFRDNDLPGIMLADAAREYANRYGVAAGTNVVVFTTNDGAYGVAADLAAAGIQVDCILDPRPNAGVDALARAESHGLRVVNDAVIEAAEGTDRIAGVRVRVGRTESYSVPCDCLAVSGGWTPAVQLFTHAGGRLRYSEVAACQVPAGGRPEVSVVGAAAGSFGLERAVAQGAAAGLHAPRRLGLRGADVPVEPPAVAADSAAPSAPLWLVPAADRDYTRHFVDLQRDATVADVQRAVDAGLRSPEHVKRYTTIGTGSDQGKTANMNALGIIAELTDADLASLTGTSSRPPVVPVPFSLIAGRARGKLLDPERITTIHDWHVEHGAVFEDVGQWKRPWFYPRGEESMQEAVNRECLAVRTGVGIMDASTLGKIDVQGPDAAEFLDRVYTNLMSGVRIGTCRYGLICGVDGMVLDDGVVMRFAEDHFVTTTTTGNAAMVLEWMEEWLQTEWPDLRVRLTSVTEQWAVLAVAGPASRQVVAQLVDPAIADDLDFMELRETTITGIAGRIMRVSFSGELAFELHVPSTYAYDVWERTWAAGADHAITAYGTETMHVLRAEKGFVIVGQDTDGTVTPQDLGMQWIVSKKKDFFVGRRSHRRPDMTRQDRRQLVGLLSDEPALRLPEGAAIVFPSESITGWRTAGHVSSSYFSPTLGRTFALALLEGGRSMTNETVEVMVADTPHRAHVTDTVFYDQEGARRDG